MRESHVAIKRVGLPYSIRQAILHLELLSKVVFERRLKEAAFFHPPSVFFEGTMSGQS